MPEAGCCALEDACQALMRLLGMAQVAKKARGMSGSLTQSFSAMDLDQGKRLPLERAITALLEAIAIAMSILRISEWQPLA